MHLDNSLLSSSGVLAAHGAAGGVVASKGRANFAEARTVSESENYKGRNFLTLSGGTLKNGFTGSMIVWGPDNRMTPSDALVFALLCLDKLS